MVFGGEKGERTEKEKNGGKWDVEAEVNIQVSYSKSRDENSFVKSR